MQIIAASHLMPISAEPLQGGAVAFEDGIIRAVGTLEELRLSFAAPVLEFPGHALMPGLVNAHTHLELTHFPAWRLRKDLQYAPRTYVDWIIQVIKIKRTLGQEELTASLREGLDISLQAGTTMVGDILSDLRLLPAYCDTALSGRIYLELIGQAPPHIIDQEEMRRRLLTVPDRFLAGIAPHTPFTVSADYFRSIMAAARSCELPVTMHLAESREEAAFFHDSTGRIATELYPFINWESYLPPPLRTTPVGWVNSAGGFGPDFLAVHAVHVNSADARTIKQSGAAVVLCPRSNQRLDVGLAPVPLFKSLDIPLALGTDSLASNDSLSLWDEMRYLLELYPGLFTSADVLKMGTLGGARAIGRGREAGSLEPGKRADFLLVEPLQAPFSADLPEQILYNSRVSGVWAGGEIAVRVA
jgi:cytosine/adenosine deaminase-related metal-dependent hydrolase